MRSPCAQPLHHRLKHAALRHRAIIEIEQLRPALKGEGCIRFRRHRVKEKPQGAFRVLTLDLLYVSTQLLWW